MTFLGAPIDAKNSCFWKFYASRRIRFQLPLRCQTEHHPANANMCCDSDEIQLGAAQRALNGQRGTLSMEYININRMRKISYKFSSKKNMYMNSSLLQKIQFMRKNILFEIRSELKSWNLDSTDDHIESDSRETFAAICSTDWTRFGVGGVIGWCKFNWNSVFVCLHFAFEASIWM